jgi:hypothetical protein
MRLSTRLMIAMTALVVLTATLVGALTYRALANLAVPRTLDRLQSQAESSASTLSSLVRSARRDVLGFAASESIQGLARALSAGGTDPQDGVPAGRWRERLERQAELRSHRAGRDRWSRIGAC